MRLICLNTWAGKKFGALADFIKKESPETDVFCFQEVFDAVERHGEHAEVRFGLLEELKALLPDFEAFFSPMLLADEMAAGVASGAVMGNAIFRKRSLRSSEEGGLFAYGSLHELHWGDPHRTGFLQHQKLETDEGVFTVCNFHGMAAWPKTDTAARLEQSNNILKFLSGVEGPKVLCGDFNVFPDTKSIAVLGHAMKNLVQKFGVKTTRSKFLYEKFKGEAVMDNISDYMFVSPDVRINSFSVLEAEVSDHLPLMLDFSL